MTSIAVIVPTVNRADMLPALVDNIHEVTEADHTIYFVMEDTDKPTLAVTSRLDGVSVIGRFGSCARAINMGYRASVEPFVAITNDDCIFHRGWDKGLDQFNDTTHIVGLDDGTGDFKCMFLVRRAFIEEHSGVFDKPNTLFHEYKSQGPDTEFAFYAMLRGVWGLASGCVIEHVNWRRGADPNHPNYVKARKTINEDLAEYLRRWPLWDPGHRMPPPVPTVTPL